MDIISKIRAILKRKKEKIVIELIIQEYDKSNFYIALVYNMRIEKFRVLFVPIDAIDHINMLEEYFEYQFIFIETVNYLLQSIKLEQVKYNMNDRLLKKDNFDKYLISLNTYVDSKDCSYNFTQFIDKKFFFLYDVIMMLFDHSPHIISELGNKILGLFNNSESFKYEASYDIDIKDYDKLFSDDIKSNSDNLEVSFIENNGNRYYAVINDQIIIVDYFPYKKLLNINTNLLDRNVYIVLKSICNNVYKPFYKIKVVDEKDDFNDPNIWGNIYYCYGVFNGYLKIIDNDLNNKLSFKYINKKLVKLIKYDNYFINEIKLYLSKKYDDNKVMEMINFIKN